MRRLFAHRVATINNAPYRTVIRANQPWWRIDWRSIYKYRDLLWLLILRDLTAVYKQSILGPVWFVLQPLATTVVFTIVFGKLAQIGTEGIPPFLFYLNGMVLWNYFQGCLNSVSNSLVANAGVLGKVYFPRLILPLSIVGSNLAQFLINFLMFVGFYAYYLLAGTALSGNAGMVFVPLLVFQTAAVGLGAGLWFSALTTRYRDLRFALPFLSQLWLFATPIIYASKSVISAKWHFLLSLNPMSVVIEINRYSFLGVGETDLCFLATSFASGLIILITGLFVFNRIERTFVDTI